MTDSSSTRRIAVTSDPSPSASHAPSSSKKASSPPPQPRPPSSPPSPPSSPQPPHHTMNPLPPELRSPMYVPSDSSSEDDVQYVTTHRAPKSSDVLSDHVRITLQQLELRNIILSLPSFCSYIPFSRDDKAIAASLADIHRARLETPTSAILILTTSLQRARRWRLLLSSHSELLPFVYFPDRLANLNPLLREHGVVIAHITDALMATKHRQLSLRKLALLVVDAAEQVTDRAHASAVLIRDYYRALGERQRPRILAIARTHIPEPAMYPLEYNLLSHFISAKVTQDVKWPSSYGKGSRPPGAGLIDLEYLYYSSNTLDNNEPRPFEKRRPVTPQPSRDRRTYSEVDHLVEQVGPLGVAAYTKMKEFKRQLRSDPGKLLPDKLSISDRDALVGLSSKALSLINEIHLAYAASTRFDRLAAIVYAGRPVVACALCEILRAFPIFRGLCARVVLGVQDASAPHKDHPRDDFEDLQWQGGDTDDEEVSSFTAGETNILFVANSFCTKTPRNRPLPPTPLVLRFDGSAPNPGVDGGGGRCRVVVFRQHEAKGHAQINTQLTSHEASKDASHKERVTNFGRTNGDFSRLPASPDTGDLSKSTLPSKTTDGLGSKATVLSSLEQGRISARVRPARRSVEDTEEESQVYHCAPAKPLLGPIPGSDSPSFLYRILFLDQNSGTRMLEGGNRHMRVNGIEDFLLVLSSKVDEQDITIMVSDLVFGTGNRTKASGYLRLDFQGSVTLTSEQINIARQYNEEMFSLLLAHVHKTSFVWNNFPERQGSGDNANLNRINRCRNYLVLPGKNQPTQSSKKDDPSNAGARVWKQQKKESELASCVSKYFDDLNEEGTPKSHLGRCEIDWETVHTILNVADPEKYEEEARRIMPRKPGAFKTVEGKLLFSKLSGGIFALSGRLRYDMTPLTVFTRSRKFPLNDDGTFMKHEDLQHLIDVVASKNTIAKQAQANLSNNISLLHEENVEQHTIDLENSNSPDGHSAVSSPNSEGNQKQNSTKLSPAKWNPTRECLILDNAVCGKRQRTSENGTRFDCDRNVKKKRKTWVGRVRYSIETYFNKYYDKPVTYLDQPLLDTSRHRVANVENLLEVVRGTPISTLCERFVTMGIEKRLLIPELARLFPLSVQAILLPAALFLMEKHLSICELRTFFDSKTNVKGTTHELLQAVTSTAVNPSKNYERLELLGDSVLKLSCTVRLFTKHPHYTEGQMHHARAHLVSNARLHRRGERRGLFNYVRFQTETSMDWFPPGTDLDGRAQRLTVKGLADVVEAMCGVYFLFGSRRDYGNSEKAELLEFDMPKVSSDWEVDLTYDSGPEESDGDPDVQEEINMKERFPENESKGTMNNVQNETGTAQECLRNDAVLHPLAAASVDRGYIAGYKFLEACSIFDDHEPSHSQILLSSAHAMLPKGSKPPQELNERAFPRDDRLLRPNKSWEEEYGILENSIGYKFKRRPLLLCAVTHGSYIKNDHRVVGDEQTFQRLEFLGDAVADFCVVRYLYERYPRLGPGELTELKGNVVSNEAFARTTVALGLHKFLCHASLAMTEEIDSYIGTVNQDLTVENELGAHGGLKRSLGEIAAPKVLGDILEAVLGAVYVDSGLQQAWRVCMKLLGDSLRINADPLRQDMHPCTELAEMASGVWKLGEQPKYDTRDLRHKTRGEEDVRTRLASRKEASVYILNEKVAQGHGSTVKRAKLKAAVAAMKLLRDEDPESRGGRLLRRLKDKSVKQQIAERRHMHYK